MSAWLDPLHRALDSAPAPVSFFFRDDDAGWDDERLFALLDLFAYHALPLDLAVIPESLSAPLARRLCAYIDADPQRIGLHQHGFAHVNHEPEGRKCEFGLTRSPAAQRRNIELGWRRLNDLVGPRVHPIFTPPWNRCTRVTGACLVKLGFRVLSRDSTAMPLRLAGLIELPIRIDWLAHRKGQRLSQEALGVLLADALTTPHPIGIMFHHAQMDSDERRATGELLRLLARHDAVRCHGMWSLVAQGAPDLLSRVA